MKRLRPADWATLVLATITFAVIVAVLAQNFLGID